MSVPENLHPTYQGKMLTALKAMPVKWFTFIILKPIPSRHCMFPCPGWTRTRFWGPARWGWLTSSLNTKWSAVTRWQTRRVAFTIMTWSLSTTTWLILELLCSRKTLIRGWTSKSTPKEYQRKQSSSCSWSRMCSLTWRKSALGSTARPSCCTRMG